MEVRVAAILLLSLTLSSRVTPAKAGAHCAGSAPSAASVPAFAGKTLSVWVK
jgi:hypothetical protein